MLPLKEFYSINEDDKDSLYADRMIKFIRQNQQPLVSVDHAKTGLDYLLAQQNMSTTEDLFQNTSAINLSNIPSAPVPLVDAQNRPINSHRNTPFREMTGIQFKSLPVLMKVFRIITGEVKKMGTSTTVRANDPTSNEKRRSDEILIKNRKKFESLFTYLYQSIGHKEPVQMSEYKDRFGEKHDNGNTKDFDAMGFDAEDKDDVSVFMSRFYKLDWEIEMEKVINAILSFNEVDQNNIERWVVDILCKNAGAGQIYVSDENGAIVIDYLTPETVYIYGSSRRKDFNDAMAKSYEQNVTVKQFLDRVGAAYDYEENLDSLTLAVFYASSGSIDITGINPDFKGIGTGDDWYCKTRSGTTYPHSEFMNFKVCLGYMEWTSQNYTEYRESLKGKGKKFDGDKRKEKSDTRDGFSTPNNQPADDKKYPTKARYECPTYKSYYLALTSLQHIKFKFGKVTYQDIKGYNDFNTNFSIITYKEIGDPIAIMAIPMIDIINEAFWKWRWILRRSKAPGTDYNVNSLMAIADSVFCDTDGRENRIQKTMQWLDSSSNSLWAFPKDDDGRPLNYTISQLNIEKENGLKEGFMKYWETMTVTWDKLIDMLIGNSDLRQGESASSKASMNNEFKSLEYSQMSTSYLPDMITFLCTQSAVRSGMIVQDIIQFKDYDTLAYKFLEDLVGDEALEKIEGMGKTALHRYGINVESLNQAPRLAKLSQRIDFAIQNGKLTNAQALLIEDIKSPNLAYRTLAYFEQRNDKIKQKQAMELQQAQGKQQQQLEAMRQKMEMIKGDYMIAGKKIDAESAQQNHVTNQIGGIAKTAMKTKADSDNLVAQTMGNLIEMQHENNLATKQPTPNIPQPPLPQVPQGPAPIPSNEIAPNQFNQQQQQPPA